jgi:hypothetical protein
VGDISDGLGVGKCGEVTADGLAVFLDFEEGGVRTKLVLISCGNTRISVAG